MKQFFAAIVLGLCVSLNLMAGGPGGNPGTNEDFCTTINAIIKLAPTNFAAIKGELNEEMTEEEEEDVFNATNVVPGFDYGIIHPALSLSTPKMKASYYKVYHSDEEAQAALKTTLASVKACLKTGYAMEEDSGIYSWDSGTVHIALMTVKDFDEDDEEITKVLINFVKH